MEITGLEERIASLEKENGDLKRALQEIERMIVLQDNTAKEMVQQLSMVKTAIREIAEHTQRQIHFNESAKTSMAELVQEVQKHQNNFQEVVRVLKNHEKHILKNGTASDEMGQYINALVQDSQNKNVWIGNLMREKQEQSQVLRQHHMGQQAIADVIKLMMAGQYHGHQPQMTTRRGQLRRKLKSSTERTRIFRMDRAHPTPPNNGPFGVVDLVPQVPTSLEMVQRLCVLKVLEKMRNQTKKAKDQRS